MQGSIFIDIDGWRLCLFRASISSANKTAFIEPSRPVFCWILISWKGSQELQIRSTVYVTPTHTHVQYIHACGQHNVLLLQWLLIFTFTGVVLQKWHKDKYSLKPLNPYWTAHLLVEIICPRTNTEIHSLFFCYRVTDLRGGCGSMIHLQFWAHMVLGFITNPQVNENSPQSFLCRSRRVPELSLKHSSPSPRPPQAWPTG